METLIVSKTRTNSGKCIGGILLENNRSVRLVRPDETYWPDNCGIEVGEVWDLNFHNRPNITAPFTEDVIVNSKQLLRRVDNVQQYLLTNQQNLRHIFWSGDVNSLYEGRVQFQSSNNRAYVGVNNPSSMSTGFWIPSSDLILQADNKHYACGWQIVVYVGTTAPLPRINAGTLCRVSLARPIIPHPDFQGPERCYVQLSGWYL